MTKPLEKAPKEWLFASDGNTANNVFYLFVSSVMAARKCMSTLKKYCISAKFETIHEHFPLMSVIKLRIELDEIDAALLRFCKDQICYEIEDLSLSIPILMYF